ncbi:MAG TPA: glucose 1-dehydrogenase [Spirochaetia bacterium]|nr:glucose 1-dehydrogenase [Spirochaetia bacterium]
MSRKTLEGQIALVTGASSGIGAAVAVELAREGAKVIVNYHSNRTAGEEVAHTIEREGGEAIAVGADVRDEGAVQSMFRTAIDSYGTVDILVNNSGIQIDEAFHTMSVEQWDAVVDTHLKGHFLCTREAVREFLGRGMRPVSKALGKVICMSSVHDVIPWSMRVGYASAKGGIIMFMKSVAQEYAERHIRVNAISPGAIRTPLNREAWETPEAERELLRLIPTKRIGEPDEIGRVAVWLSSDESDYVTGTTIYVDGGMTLYAGFESGG